MAMNGKILEYLVWVCPECENHNINFIRFCQFCGFVPNEEEIEKNVKTYQRYDDEKE